MKTWGFRIGVGCLVVIIGLGFAASAMAQGPDRQPWRSGKGDRVGKHLLDAVMQATGLSEQDVLSQLKEGQPLADIATAHGAVPQAIMDDVKAILTTEIESAVDEGHMRARPAQWMIERLDTLLDRAMHASLPLAEHPWAVRTLGEVIQVLAEEADVLPRSILSEALDGSTLAEIAAAHGVEEGSLIAAVEAHIAEHLQTAMENGRLTSEERDRLLSELSTALPELLDASLPQRLATLGENADTWRDSTLVAVIADMAGVELDDLIEEHLTLPSLDEVAGSYGLDPEAVLSQTETQIRELVNEAVADGRLSQERADAILAELDDRLERRFEAPFRPTRRPLIRR